MRDARTAQCPCAAIRTTCAPSLIAEELGVVLTDGDRWAARRAARPRDATSSWVGVRERPRCARASSRRCTARSRVADCCRPVLMRVVRSTSCDARATPSGSRWRSRGRASCSRAMARVVARAPGRLDVMGGIADYSGSLVLADSARIARRRRRCSRRTIARIEIVSLRGGRDVAFSIALDELLLGELRDPRARGVVRRARAGAVGGVRRRCGARVSRAARLRRRRAARRLPAAHRVRRAGRERRELVGRARGGDDGGDRGALRRRDERRGDRDGGQWAENHIAGAPCGIMDQMTSACGRRDRLLRLRCQPATIEGHVDVPPGYPVLWNRLGHPARGDGRGLRNGAHRGVHGLSHDRRPRRPRSSIGRRDRARATIRGGTATSRTSRRPSSTTRFAPHLPERMRGAEFLAPISTGSRTPCTRVEPDREVSRATVDGASGVRASARDAIRRAAPSRARARADVPLELGALMYAVARQLQRVRTRQRGHRSARRDGSRRDGPARGLFGAKITGGGSGGTVAVLGRSDAEAAVREIARRYAEETGRAAEVFVGIGAGRRGEWGDRGVKALPYLVRLT